MFFSPYTYGNNYKRAKARENEATNSTHPEDKYVKSYRLQSHILTTHVQCCQAQNKQSLHKDLIQGWRRGVVASVVRRMNEVTLRRPRLVLGWVTVFGRVYHHGM